MKDVTRNSDDGGAKLGKWRQFHLALSSAMTLGLEKELFTVTNRATRFPDQTYALPCANDLYVVNGKKYRVVGIRKGSTETMCEMDVHEEAD